MMVAVVGDTDTVATGTGVTVIVLVPVLPSLVAVIVAEPTPTAIARPDALTAALLSSEDDHTTLRP